MDQEATKKWKEIVSLDARGYSSLVRKRLEYFVRIYPKLPRGWLWLGATLTDMADYDAARSALTRAEKLCKPQNRYWPYQLKGELYRKKGNLAKAEDWFRKSLALNPDNGTCWIFLGAVCASLGKLKEAKDAHRRAIKTNNCDVDEAHLNIGLIYRAEKKYKLALREAEKALAITPKYRAAKKLQRDLERVIEG